jgi:FtsP/CotA-like multicopper oxidase with cupredoxin domain
MMGTGDDVLGRELPFYQIGAEQGFLPQVTEVSTGFATALPGDGRNPRPADRAPAPSPDQALLMGLAERADVLVDFRFLRPGTVVRMINTAPDAPFGGFPDTPADPGTTGQVMQFVVKYKLLKVLDIFTTPPWALKLNAEAPLGAATSARNVSLNEGESEVVCVLADAETEEFAVPIVQVACDSTPPEGQIVVPFAPKEALLGTVGCIDAMTGDPTPDPPSGSPPACPSGQMLAGNPLHWTDHTNSGVDRVVVLENGGNVTVNVTENPDLDSIEEWNLINFTMDAHPIHLHLVRFQVVARTLFDGTPSPNGSVQAWESGFKDTVIAYPGEITTIKAKFDIPGLYVWHCHILEHEDNEMMRPYFVGP